MLAVPLTLDYLASAAWYGTRIILHQVSPESIGVFDFILELYTSCSGNWGRLIEENDLSAEECDAFLNYSATFLSNIGNYYVSIHRTRVKIQEINML